MAPSAGFSVRPGDVSRRGSQSVACLSVGEGAGEVADVRFGTVDGEFDARVVDGQGDVVDGAGVLADVLAGAPDAELLGEEVGVGQQVNLAVGRRGV